MWCWLRTSRQPSWAPGSQMPELSCLTVGRCRTWRRMFKLAVSADLSAQSPSLMLCLRTLAQVPRGTFELHSTAAANWPLLSLLSERSTAPSGVQLLHRSVPAFISRARSQVSWVRGDRRLNGGHVGVAVSAADRGIFDAAVAPEKNWVGEWSGRVGGRMIG